MPQKPHLRLVFVQLLFALTIGQLALKIGDAIIGRPEVIGKYFNDITFHPYLYSHFLLCIFLITTSWIGWQSSKSSDSPQLSGFVISIEYLVLLLDLFLVICYFIIVRGSEISSTHAIIKEGEMKLDYPVLPADSLTERFWIMVVFGTYLIWDIFTKVVVRDYKTEQNDGKIKYIFYTKGNFKNLSRSIITLVCFTISLVVYYCLNSTGTWQTFYVDFILIALIWSFRGWKQTIHKKEYKLDKEQLPKFIIDKLNSDIKFPIIAIENNYRLKIFFARILPIIIFGFCMWFYFKNNQ